MSLPDVNTNNEMPVVPLKQLRVLTNKLKHLDDDTELSLQLILTALFPSVWQNIEKYSNDCYTTGYLRGLEDASKRNS